MTFIKLGGPSGNIEPIGSIPAGTDRVQAFGVAIENVVGTGATEMYATIMGRVCASFLHDYTVSEETWTPDVADPGRCSARLGGGSRNSYAFILCPLALTAILIVGWCIVASRAQPNIAFNPLHPTSALAAGMNREEMSGAVRAHDTADEKALGQLPLVLRFRPVTNERWGIDTRATPPNSVIRSDEKMRQDSENLGVVEGLLSSPTGAFSWLSVDYPPLMGRCQKLCAGWVG